MLISQWCSCAHNDSNNAEFSAKHRMHSKWLQYKHLSCKDVKCVKYITISDKDKIHEKRQVEEGSYWVSYKLIDIP